MPPGPDRSSTAASELSLDWAISALLRHWTWLVIPAIVGAIAGFAATSADDEEWTATSRVLLAQPTGAGVVAAILGVPEVGIVPNTVNGPAELIDEARTAELASSANPDLDPIAIESAITLAPEGLPPPFGDVVQVTAHAASLEQATAFASAFAEALVEDRRKEDRAAVRQGEDEVRAGIARALATGNEKSARVEGRLGRKLLLIIGAQENFIEQRSKIVTAAGASEATADAGKARNALVGLLAGLMLGAGAALIRDRSRLPDAA